MPRGYRSVILAALGCLILANAAQDKDKSGQQRERAGQAKQHVASPAFIKPAESPQSGQPDQGQCIDDWGAKRDCQIASAQATIDQARYAYWQTAAALLGLIVGIGTLGAALWAGSWAKKAANHTESGSMEARRSAAAAEKAISESWKSQRAWMSYTQVDRTTFFVASTKRIAGFTFKVQWKNAGLTPALNVSSYIETTEFASEEEFNSHVFADRLSLEEQDAGVVGPGITISTGRQGVPVEGMRSIKTGKIVIIRSVVRYNDIFTDITRETAVTLMIDVMGNIDDITPENPEGALTSYRPIGPQNNCS